MLPFTAVPTLSSLYYFDKTDDFIESGQFGVVYRATALSDRAGVVTKGTAVAVKELSKNKISNDKEFGDIINEVEVLKRLKHRNCTRFVEALQTNAHVYIIMELVDNAKDLFAAMREHRTADLRETWSRSVMQQLLTALSYLHRELRIVHRDVKPENILLTTDEQGLRVVLIDYGLAKYMGASGRHRLTPAMLRQKSVEALCSMGASASALAAMKPSASMDSLDGDARSNSPMLSTPCGTLKYLAPETVRGLAEHGAAPRCTTRGDLPQSDMYAVGIILYAMLSTVPPFSGSTRGDLIRQMETGPSFEGAYWKDISLEARDFVKGLLHSTPNQRLTVSQALRNPWIRGAKPVPSCSSVLSCAADETLVMDRNQLNNLIDCASGSSHSVFAKAPPPTIPQARATPTTNKYFSFLGQDHVPMDQS